MPRTENVGTRIGEAEYAALVQVELTLADADPDRFANASGQPNRSEAIRYLLALGIEAQRRAIALPGSVAVDRPRLVPVPLMGAVDSWWAYAEKGAPPPHGVFDAARMGEVDENDIMMLRRRGWVPSKEADRALRWLQGLTLDELQHLERARDLWNTFSSYDARARRSMRDSYREHWNNWLNEAPPGLRLPQAMSYTQGATSAGDSPPDGGPR